jgi:hypothetical protein
MESKEALAVIEKLIFQKRNKKLSEYEIILIEGLWEGKTYKDIAENTDKKDSYFMHTVAPSFFELMTFIFEEDVNKRNLRAIIERFQRQQKEKRPTSNTLSISNENDLTLDLLNTQILHNNQRLDIVDRRLGVLESIVMNSNTFLPISTEDSFTPQLRNNLVSPYSIPYLINVIKSSSNESELVQAVYQLSWIGEGTDKEIDCLLSLLQITNKSVIIFILAQALVKFGYQNQKVIQALQAKLNDNLSEEINLILAGNLLKLDRTNELALSSLIEILKCSNHEFNIRNSAYFLGELDFKYEQVISELISILESTQNESTRRRVTDSLGKIAVGNEQSISALIRILETTQDESTLEIVTDSLGKIAVGNEQAISELIRILETTQDEKIRENSLVILPEIAVGNEKAILSLMNILETSSDQGTLDLVADSLAKIAVGNKETITQKLTENITVKDQEHFLNKYYMVEILRRWKPSDINILDKIANLYSSNYFKQFSKIKRSLEKIQKADNSAYNYIGGKLPYLKNNIVPMLEVFKGTENHTPINGTVRAMGKTEEKYQYKKDLKIKGEDYKLEILEHPDGEQHHYRFELYNTETNQIPEGLNLYIKKMDSEGKLTEVGQVCANKVEDNLKIDLWIDPDTKIICETNPLPDDYSSDTCDIYVF